MIVSKLLFPFTLLAVIYFVTEIQISSAQNNSKSLAFNYSPKENIINENYSTSGSQLFEIAKGTVCPRDEYKGNDLDQIKERLKVEFDLLQNHLIECFSLNLVKVIIPGKEWKRSTWDEWVDYTILHHDESKLKVAIVIQPKENPHPEMAYLIYYNLIQNHLMENKINYTCFYCNDGNNQPMALPVMLKNVK